MSELASVSVSAIPTHEIEAGFTARQAGSGYFLLSSKGFTYAFTSAISDRKRRAWDRGKVISRGNTAAKLSYSRARLPQG